MQPSSHFRIGASLLLLRYCDQLMEVMELSVLAITIEHEETELPC
jgi:hypothetical protein